MQILDDQDLWSTLGGVDEKAPKRLEDLAAALRGAHGPHPVIARVDGQQGPQVRRDGPEIGAELRDPSLELRGDGRFAVALLDAEPAPDQVDQRMKGHGLPEREAMAFVPGGGGADPAVQLEKQPRLPDARLADDEYHLTLARLGAGRTRRAAGPAHARAPPSASARAPPRHRGACASRGRRPLPTTRTGSALPFRSFSPERPRLEIVVHEPMGRLGDRHPPGSPTCCMRAATLVVSPTAV